MNKEDINADIEMCFMQIILLTDLMMECNNGITPNLLTIRDLANSGLNKIIKIS